MTRSRSIVGPLVGLVAVVMVSLGCASNPTPLTQYGTAQDSFNAAVRAVIALRQAGKIPDGEYHSIVLPAIKAGDAALDSAAEAVAAGQPLDLANAGLQAAAATLRAYLQAHGGGL